jgi:NitT/TauT family transport system substrate-binding protein
MMVHDSSSVHTFSDLSGHTVAAQLGVAWLLYVINNYHLKNVNIVPLSTNYAPFLHDPNYIQQVFVTSEPPIMTHKGIKVRTLWVKESGCDAYLALECSDQYLAAHPAAARAFIAATIQGWRGYLADPASTDAEIMRHNPEMDELQLSLSRQAMIDYHLVDGTKEGIGGLDPARLANQYRILRSLNIITTDYDVTKSYSTAYLPAEKFFATPPPAK